jgi:hypothetical protein
MVILPRGVILTVQPGMCQAFGPRGILIFCRAPQGPGAVIGLNRLFASGYAGLHNQNKFNHERHEPHEPGLKPHEIKGIQGKPAFAKQKFVVLVRFVVILFSVLLV